MNILSSVGTSVPPPVRRDIIDELRADMLGLKAYSENYKEKTVSESKVY